MEVEVDGETEVECICPNCKHKFTTNAYFSTSVEIEPSDMDWYD